MSAHGSEIAESYRPRRGEISCSGGNAKDPILSADGQGNILYINEAGQRVFGYTADEVLGKQLTLLLDANFYREYLRVTTQADREAEAGAAALTSGAIGKRKDGSEFPIEFSPGDWTDQGEKLVSVIVRDITKRRESENQIREKQERLKSEVAERQRAEEELTRALAEIQQ